MNENTRYALQAQLTEYVPYVHDGCMIFTIEPMINAGGKSIRAMPDGWTIRTKDRSLSAQWEHTILVTDTGYEVLTVSPDMPSPPNFAKKK